MGGCAGLRLGMVLTGMPSFLIVSLAPGLVTPVRSIPTAWPSKCSIVRSNPSSASISVTVSYTHLTLPTKA